MKNFYKGGRGLCYLKRLSHLFKSKNNRSRTLFIFVLSLICVLFSDAQAQSGRTLGGVVRSTADGQEGIEALQIGDLMYDIQLDKTINPHTGQSTARLSEFSGKVIILDFWATWCAPCIAMLPKMDSLQCTYSDKLQFLSVTSETETVVRSFLDRMQAVHSKKSSLTYVVEDRLLKRMFPHASIPHYVWIDGRGKVIAITGMEEINGENIQKAITEQVLSLPTRNSATATYDKTRPFLFNTANIHGAELLASSALVGYIEGVGSGYIQTVSIINDEDPLVNGNVYRRISARNLSIAQLYQLAFTDGNRHFGWENTILDVKNPDELQRFVSGGELIKWWETGNAFCYELLLPKDRADEAWEVMKADLIRHFPKYSAMVEKRDLPSLCLVTTKPLEKMKYLGDERLLDIGPYGGTIKGYTIPYLLRELNDKGLKRYKKPLIDLTGYSSLINMEIKADLGDLKSVNTALSVYGLQIVEQVYEREVLVIRDAKQNGNL
ncbi:TlpA family protein disulfide reductase [Sphingobacterium pedocola]|uniref:Thioredoxin domain-containing protein n=1 Tax=Sphingobacterium pedocola TaxID=2082722 RepID=A0ABR9T9N7_9SPHI|nr:TlpA disulfide reductase family protein [Sphingobacterium pedocola]MBE8722020.1 hypothetical protein [Sphingobacterium pedocola]